MPKTNAKPKPQPKKPSPAKTAERVAAAAASSAASAATSAAVGAATKQVVAAKNGGKAHGSVSSGAVKTLKARLNAIMLLWALPDELPPYRFGMMGGRGTAVVPLHQKPKMKPCPASSNIPSSQGVGSFPVNELFSVTFHKHPMLASATLEWISTEYAQYLDCYNNECAVGPMTFVSASDNQGDQYTKKGCPLFTGAEMGIEGTGFFTDGPLPLGDGASLSTPQLALVRQTGTWSSAYKYYFDVLIVSPDGVLNQYEAEIPGLNNTELDIDLLTAGVVFITYLGCFTVADGTKVDAEDAIPCESMTQNGPALCNTAPWTGGQWHIQLRPLAGNAPEVAEQSRCNSARVVATPSPSITNGDGLIQSLELPDGECFMDYTHIVGGASNGFPVSSVFDGLTDEEEVKMKMFYDLKDPGASDCWHPSGPDDFKAIVDSSSFAWKGSTVQPWGGSCDYVPLSAMKGGVMMVWQNNLANPSGRGGIWQYFHHFEFRTEVQDYPLAPPDFYEWEIESAAALFAAHDLFSGNPDHIINAIRDILSKALEVGGGAAWGLGMGMITTPGSQVPGAVIAAAGGVMQIAAKVVAREKQKRSEGAKG